ncbi:MAG: hypothetical protein J1E01_03665 [Acetatifactor sp.]|nr:hypothetical protein [Acetatifactor sp.]
MKREENQLYIIQEKRNNKKEEKLLPVRLDEKRCLTVEEFQIYCSMGRNNALKLIKKSNAGIRVGRKILVDRVAFDKWLDTVESDADILKD